MATSAACGINRYVSVKPQSSIGRKMEADSSFEAHGKHSKHSTSVRLSPFQKFAYRLAKRETLFVSFLNRSFQFPVPILMPVVCASLEFAEHR